MKKAKWLLALFSVLMFVSGLAHAMPIEVPNFAVDPSGPEFTIGPVGEADYLSDNLSAPPLLEYGVTYTDRDGVETANTLMMSWGQAVEDEPAQAGWELVFGEDPDLTNQQIILSIAPPGGWIDKNGNVIPNPGNPNPPPKDVFLGIISLSVVGIDNNNNILGGWAFNTDMALLIPLANDPGAIGLSSLANNLMQTVTINVGPVGAAVVAGSASIAGGPPGPPVPPLTAPNFLVPSSIPAASTGPMLDWTQVKALQFYENGILQGGINVVPGQTTGGWTNYWDHITVTPEPATLIVLALGAAAALLRKRRA